MVDVTTEIVIARPPDVVAAYAADPDNAPEWYRNITSVTWRTPPPLTIGSEVDFVASFLGRTMAYTYIVAEHVPLTRLVMRTAPGSSFPMETTYTWRALEDARTHMTLRNRGGRAGLLPSRIMTLAMARANRADLARLRGVLEAR
ncbi:SRPBCC family protein [Georgenia daeguensis]|uniref:SRPBCC family protein n=1 Tax=Georgenia daeguensis TaxID=908355 RepID=A0ABP8EW60_9MICO